MDAHLFAAFVADLAPLLAGARIEKIQEFGPGHLSILFFGAGRKANLILRSGRKDPFCFLSNERLAALPVPSAQIMRIRKYFAGVRLAAVVPQVWSRKIWLMASRTPETGRKSAWLCLDLVHGPSLHFPDADNLPEVEEPLWPSCSEWPAALADWRKWTVLTPALRKTLHTLPEAEQLALMADLADGGGDLFLYSSPAGNIVKISAWPLPESQREGLVETVSPDRLAALEKAGLDLVLGAFQKARERQMLAPGTARLKKIARLLEKLSIDEERLKRMAAKGAEGSLLAANLWQLPADAKLQSANCAGVEISLDRRFNIIENMERLFHEAGRGKRGLAMLGQRRIELEQEAEGIRNDGLTVSTAKPGATGAPATSKLPGHTQAFVSSDGYLILRGKDARGNLAIRRLASGHDIWVHVEQGSGAHVIIRRPHPGHEIPETTLAEAGTLAANKSWLAEAASGSVMYAELRHTRPCRSGPAGKVLIDRIWQTMIVPVDHSLEQRLEKRT